jgi:CheY-like chemotaxis protein
LEKTKAAEDSQSLLELMATNPASLFSTDFSLAYVKRPRQKNTPLFRRNAVEEYALKRTAAILLIENDDNDVFFFRRAVAKTGWPGRIHVVGTATEARVYLEHQEPFKDIAYYPRPQLIVSDYRLGGHTALEFVRWLRNEPEFAAIPIVIMSGAVSGLKPEALAEIRAQAFIRKTADIESLATSLQPFLSKPAAP